MTYELYYAPGTASLVVHWLLIELDVPHTLKPLDLARGEHKSPEYLRLNPAGVVPTLLIDGVPHTEAAALALALADRHPAAGLAPAVDSAERVDYYQWAFYCANTLQPAFRNWFYPAEAAGAGQEEAVKEQARQRIEAAFARIDAHLASGGPYLLGATPRAVDFLLTMLMRWSRGMPRPATEWPAISAYVGRMRGRATFRTLYAREGLTDWA